MTEERNAIWAAFVATECQGCGDRKQRHRSVCSSCYFHLPGPMKETLYLRFGHGYEAAYGAAIEWLRANPLRTWLVEEKRYLEPGEVRKR